MILIEHNGSKSHNELANRIKEIIDDEYGVPYDFVITVGAPLTIYNIEKYTKIVEFYTNPDDDTIRYYLNIAVDIE